MLGMLFPMFGKDWSHKGVTHLFTDIMNNGYKMLYLTSRSLGQSQMTKDYLKGVKQDENVVLPDGPVLTSPSRLFKAFKQEVIDKEPQLFKISALMTI